MPRSSQFDQHFTASERDELLELVRAAPAMSIRQFRAVLSERGLELSSSSAGRAKQCLEKRIRDTLRGPDVDKALQSAISTGMIVTRRLQRDMLKAADGPVNTSDLAHYAFSVRCLAEAHRIVFRD